MKVIQILFNHSEFVFLFLGIIQSVHSDNCLDVDSVVQRDKYMEHQVFRKFLSQSLYTCASECLMSSACLSFGFDKKMRTCLLNSNSSDTGNLVDRGEFLFSDIQHWPQSLSGRCAQRMCPNKSSCEVTRLGLASCVPEFQGCGHPPEVVGANTMYDGHYQGAVATYSCGPDYRACSNSTCQSSGAWEGVDGLCKQFRWHDSINLKGMYSFPCGPTSTFRLIVNATPTEATRWLIRIKQEADTLFHSEFRLGYKGVTDVVVMNTEIDNVWGTEARSDVAMAVDKAMNVQISLQDGVYMLVVDGASLHNFTERDHGAKPDLLSIWGDVFVSMVEFMS